MTTKVKRNFQFESAMVNDLNNFVWDDHLELYEDEKTQLCWLTWLTAEDSMVLENDCMIGNTWFIKDTPVSALIKFAENIYKAEAVAQNSKIEFGTDDNEVWWAHDVPYFGEVQMNWIKEDQEWDIYLDGCWQGPFNSKSECIQHLEECIQEQEEEARSVYKKVT